MDEIKEIYQNNLIYIFRQDQCLHLSEKYLVIVKNDCEIQKTDHCLTMHYQDDFESLLKFNLPTKMRKTKQLLSYEETYTLIEKNTYGVLSFNSQNIPYSVGLNHVMINGQLYFHCAQSGFKLNGIGQRASFLVIEDLGVNLDVGTHNHNSVYVLGTLKEITDFDEKKTVLLKLVEKLAPKHPYNDRMLSFTNILKLDIDYMIGKTHIR